jgi:hypothetical protein
MSDASKIASAAGSKYPGTDMPGVAAIQRLLETLQALSPQRLVRMASKWTGQGPAVRPEAVPLWVPTEPSTNVDSSSPGWTTQS